jgi:hypothetical protein
MLTAWASPGFWSCLACSARDCGFAGDPADWSMAPPLTYRGLRVTETDEPLGRVLVWDRARETEMVQVIRWSG